MILTILLKEEDRGSECMAYVGEEERGWKER